MKLSQTVTLRLSLIASLILALWSVFFYLAVIDEVRDETDDSLEDYSEMLMIRYLSGQTMPTKSIGSNNQYFLREVSDDYAQRHPVLTYEDRNVYIDEKDEEEPARVLTTLFRKSDGSWMQLEVSTPSIDKSDLRKAIFGWLAFLYLTLIAMVIVCNYWVIRRGLQPLYILLEWLRNYRIGKASTPPNNPTKVSEFCLLNEVMKDTIQRSETLFRQQKEFVGNASHEMQTPLAVACGRLEMLLSEETLQEEQAHEVFKTLQTLQRLSETNRALLLLSKIDGGLFSEKEEVNLQQTVEKVLPDFQTAYAHLHIQTDLLIHDATVWTMHPALANTLLQCLVKNAYTHNHPNGTIRIVLEKDRLCVANSGSRQPLDSESIFTRFHHSPDKKDSTGLGLSIAEAICRSQDLSLRYEYIDGLHSFTVEAGTSEPSSKSTRPDL